MSFQDLLSILFMTTSDLLGKMLDRFNDFKKYLWVPSSEIYIRASVNIRWSTRNISTREFVYSIQVSENLRI